MMDYIAMIQNRKSVRAFRTKKVPASIQSEIKAYYENCPKLLPEVKTELLVLDESVQKTLEGTAGYEKFMIGAPNYLVLLSEENENAEINGGYIMEDLILKLTELDMNTCWITFADAAEVKEALKLDTAMKVVAICAFGYGEKTSKLLRLNIKNMSNVDITAKRGYYSPKKGIYDMVSLHTWGNIDGLDEMMGFYEDMLWQSFYCATLSPSYLNRQPYGFVLENNQVTLVSEPDSYTDKVSADLGIGIVMRHFDAAAGQCMGHGAWALTQGETALELPEGHTAVAVYKL